MTSASGATTIELSPPLPHSLDAERSVLGAILIDNHTLNAAIEKLKPDDFFLDQHRRIFDLMIALGETQQAIDLVTLTDDLHRKGGLEAAGGAAYVATQKGLRSNLSGAAGPHPGRQRWVG